MAYFRIKQPNQPTKYIKAVDGANGTLEFTENLKEAMYRDMGFFADSDFEFIKFHFTKEYPELESMDIYDGYSDEECTTANYAALQAEPIAAADVAGVGIGALDAVEEAPRIEEYAPVYNGFTYDIGVDVGVAAAAQ